MTRVVEAFPGPGTIRYEHYPEGTNMLCISRRERAVD